MEIDYVIDYYINSNTLGVVPITFGIDTPTYSEQTEQWETWSYIFIDGEEDWTRRHECNRSLKVILNAIIDVRLHLEDAVSRHDSALFITAEEAEEGRLAFPLDLLFGGRTLHDPEIPREPKQYTRDLNDLE